MFAVKSGVSIALVTGELLRATAKTVDRLAVSCEAGLPGLAAAVGASFGCVVAALVVSAATGGAVFFILAACWFIKISQPIKTTKMSTMPMVVVFEDSMYSGEVRRFLS